MRNQSQICKKRDIPKPKQNIEAIKKESHVWFEFIKSTNTGRSINALNAINKTPNTLSINLKLNIFQFDLLLNLF